MTTCSNRTQNKISIPYHLASEAAAKLKLQSKVIVHCPPVQVNGSWKFTSLERSARDGLSLPFLKPPRRDTSFVLFQHKIPRPRLETKSS